MGFQGLGVERGGFEEEGVEADFVGGVGLDAAGFQGAAAWALVI